MTAMPYCLVGELDLEPVSATRIRGIFGHNGLPTYRVNAPIGDAAFESVYAVSLPRNHVVMGRDLISLCRLALGGKAEAGETAPRPARQTSRIR